VTVAAGEARIQYGVREVAVRSEGRRLRIPPTSSVLPFTDGAVCRPASTASASISTALVVASSWRTQSGYRGSLMARAKRATEAPTDPLDALLARL
jgi:hypothetical protein